MKSKYINRQDTIASEFSEVELESTMHRFLEGETKENGKSMFNIATITGMVLLFTALTFLFSRLGLPIADSLAEFADGAVNVFPIIGGILTLLVGFGYLVGDRKRIRKAERALKKSRKDFVNNFKSTESARVGIKNDLEEESESKSRTTFYGQYGTGAAATYKKLHRSRTNKKIAGVCGGLAEYFDISSTVVRVIFFGSAFFMYGTSILIYLALTMIIPKEPRILTEDLEF